MNTKPTIVVSKCLGFAACRYDGGEVASELIARLKPYVTFIPVCPEEEIGLGTPREPILITLNGNRRRLIQPAERKELSEIMNRFAEDFLASLKEVDGFILKSKSPSCGINDVKLFADESATKVVGKGSGFFAEAVLEKFPHLPVKTERRLQSYARERERFFERIFGRKDFPF